MKHVFSIMQEVGWSITVMTLVITPEILATEIQLPAEPRPEDKTAAMELTQYIRQITGEEVATRPEGKAVTPPVFYIGETAAAKESGSTNLEREQWIVKSVKDGVILNGGGASGSLYALWHYLEDSVGVRFWNTNEEYVPNLKNMPVTGFDLKGKPAFEFRTMNSFYISDNGRFASQIRTKDGFPFVFQPQAGMPSYGLEPEFGSPDSVHTFSRYIPYEKYFKTHPEWFPLVEGKRFGAAGAGGYGTQLCLSNKEMRKEAYKNLLEFIKKDRETAKQKGYVPPTVYNFSPNDNNRKCTCPDCQAAFKKYGSESGILIECINEFAREVRKIYPDIILHTDAYVYTEEPPKGIIPESNVKVTLCNTVGNLVLPVTHPANSVFKRMISGWSPLLPSLQVWLYGITYTEPAGLPFPSEDTYAEDLKYYRDHHVTSIYMELEAPLASDAHSYKQWLFTHLMENPDADVNALKKDFAYGYYGKAGKQFLEIRGNLRDSINKSTCYINPYATPDVFSYMDLDMTQRLYKLFEEGENVIGNDPVLLRRWHHARLSLDRSTLLRRRILIRQWLDKGGKFTEYPYPPEKIVPQIEKTLAELESMPNRMIPYYPKKQLEILRKERSRYFEKLTEKSVALPVKFKELSPNEYIDVTVDQAYRHKNIAEIRQDSTSECGTAVVVAFPKSGENIDKYCQWLPLGVHSNGLKKNLGGGAILWKDVKTRDWAWYKVGTAKISQDCYVYFFWSWIVQLNVGSGADPMRPDQKYEIWLKARFTGPHFPLGKEGEEDAIWLERVVLKKVQP